jgi:hypothetical protein
MEIQNAPHFVLPMRRGFQTPIGIVFYEEVIARDMKSAQY